MPINISKIIRSRDKDGLSIVKARLVMPAMAIRVK